MFKLTKLADYSTVIMAELARHGTKPQTAREIATRTHLPAPTVSKILKRLTRQALVDSTRGVQGGYFLAQPAEKIGLLEILSAIEGGKVALTDCAVDPTRCNVAAHCAVAPKWQSLSHIVQQALSQLHLSDLLPEKV